MFKSSLYPSDSLIKKMLQDLIMVTLGHALRLKYQGGWSIGCQGKPRAWIFVSSLARVSSFFVFVPLLLQKTTDTLSSWASEEKWESLDSDHGECPPPVAASA